MSVLDLRLQLHPCVSLVARIRVIIVMLIAIMGLIRARRVTLQICILNNPENSVILFSANLGLERRWIRSSTKGDISAEIEGNAM